jgi:HAE1 family hydrophobic/amphiphilic exporter-1
LANDVYSQIGLVMLVGLLGKNAILIVEFAVQRRREGLSLLDAAVEGGRVRFRPIQMTSFAFVAGLIPLVFSTGAGAIGNRTIGTTGVGGMLMGTVIGVLVIPGLYYIFAKIADGRKLLRDESDDPISEIFERQPLPPYQEGDFTTPTAHRTGSHPHGLAGPAPSASDSSSPPASPAELPFAEEAEDGPPPHHSPRHPS